jgi:hypothetical protein
VLLSLAGGATATTIALMTGDDVDGSVSGADLADNSIGSKNLKRHSVGAKHLCVAE